jgi:hypothetical protein
MQLYVSVGIHQEVCQPSSLLSGLDDEFVNLFAERATSAHAGMS